MFKYFPHTPADIQSMLSKIGVDSIDDLFVGINKDWANRDLHLPYSHSEEELKSEIKRISALNKPLISFLGAGSYDVFTFSVIDALASRQEFLTAYTPYQPEVSQGTLQYIFEFQTMICELAGMDIANASMYDGPTATAEAVFMACAHTRKNKVLIANTLNPTTIDVVRTYCKYRGIEIDIIDGDYHLSIDDLKNKLTDEIGAVIVGQPNYYGVVEDLQEVRNLIGDKRVFILNVDPSCLSVLKTPQEWGADIVCGEAQTLGIPLSFGGPYLGFIACVNKLMRKLPGRICGITKDVDGKRGFVLTLQAREQHIRREKANSNICSNQSLMALQAVIYMSLMGKQGMIEVAKRAYNNAHYLEKALLETGLFEQIHDYSYFKEFVLKYKYDPQTLNQHLMSNGYLGGLILDDKQMLFCASEKRSKQEIDEFVRLVGEASV